MYSTKESDTQKYPQCQVYKGSPRNIVWKFQKERKVSKISDCLFPFWLFYFISPLKLVLNLLENSNILMSVNVPKEA